MEQETTTTTIIQQPIQQEKDSSTVLFPGFRDANLNSMQSQVSEQDTNAQAEIARQNLQGTRHGTGWTAVPIPEKMKYPTITGDDKVVQRNITSQFSERVNKMMKNFSKYANKETERHMGILDVLETREGKIGYMDRKGLKGGIWDGIRESINSAQSSYANHEELDKVVRRDKMDTKKEREHLAGLRDKSGKKV